MALFLQRRAPLIVICLPWASLFGGTDKELTYPLSPLSIVQRGQDRHDLSLQWVNSPKRKVHPVQPTLVYYLLMVGAMFFLWGRSCSWPSRAARLVSQQPHLLREVLRAATSIYELIYARHLHLHNCIYYSQQLYVFDTMDVISFSDEETEA